MAWFLFLAHMDLELTNRHETSIKESERDKRKPAFQDQVRTCSMTVPDSQHSRLVFNTRLRCPSWLTPRVTQNLGSTRELGILESKGPQRDPATDRPDKWKDCLRKQMNLPSSGPCVQSFWFVNFYNHLYFPDRELPAQRLPCFVQMAFPPVSYITCQIR